MGGHQGFGLGREIGLDQSVTPLRRRTPDVTATKPKSRRFATVAWAALAGAVSGGVFLGAAELVALLAARDAGPILAVGSFVIDIVPRWAKELAISLFGSNDKLFLLGSLGFAVLVAAAVAGVLELWRRWTGVALFALAGVAAVIATVTRTGASPLAFLPSAIGAVAGAAMLRLLIRTLHRWRDAAGAADAAAAGVDRRRFLLLTSVAAVGAAVAGVGSRLGSAATSSIAAVRAALKLPAPAPASRIPDGRRAEGGGHLAALHPERGLLPGGHGPHRAVGRPGRLAADDRRDGREAHPTLVPGPARPRPRRVLGHAHLRLERGRRQPRRHGALARRPGPHSARDGAPALRGRHGALAQRRRLHRGHAASAP